MNDIKIKRAYTRPSKSDGLRILVDRLWPRGLSKEQLQIDIWARDLAPSDALRSWYRHSRTKWQAFKTRYFEELRGKSDAVQALVDQFDELSVTFVFAAKDEEYNNAVALREYIQDQIAAS